MQIHLDLLPSAQKKILRNRRLFRRALEQEVYVIIIFGVLTLGFLGIHVILVSQANVVNAIAQQRSSQEGYAEVEESRTLFASVNKRIQALHAINNGHLEWTPLLHALSGAVGANIRVEIISVSGETVQAKATARTRNDAVAFKKNVADVRVDEALCFSDVSIPEEDLVVAEATQFTIHMTMTPACITAYGSGRSTPADVQQGS